MLVVLIYTKIILYKPVYSVVAKRITLTKGFMISITKKKFLNDFQIFVAFSPEVR